MILVDTSVWIDYFRGNATAESERLDTLLDEETIVIGDIILTEILQGFERDQDFERALDILTCLDIIDLAGRDIAVKAARNFRTLRRKGITVRKTIDALIATSCIERHLPLLYADRDFDPFVAHLGLIPA